MNRMIPLVFAMGLLVPALGAAEDKPAKATKVDWQFRFRTEVVEDEALPRDSVATTLRTRLTVSQALGSDWRATLEVDDLHALDRSRYYSSVDGPTNRPLIGDPVGLDVNRAVLERKRPSHDIALGRQQILIDDQRFIGNAGWRQNEQTFDGAVLRLRPLPKTEITLGWLRNINRVYGPHTGTQAAYWHGDSIIFNASRDLGAYGTVSLYSYALAFDDAPAASNQTSGFFWRGKRTLGGGWSLPWIAAYGTQQDHGKNPIDYSADYRRIELGLAKGSVSVKLGQEVLGGDSASRPGRRVQTPLASLHAFQGWADKFTTTPPAGIDDRYVTLEAELKGYKAIAAFHDYGAEAISRDYGTEWNLSVTKRLTPKIELMLKYADYSAQGFAADTTKGWLMVTATL